MLWTLRSWIGIAGTAAAVVTAVAGAAALTQLTQYRDPAQVGERAVRIQPALDAWRSGFERDALRLEAYRVAGERQLRELALQLSAMQARIVHVDSVARRLIERAEFQNQEFDFSREPALGGPEEPPLDVDEDGSYSAELPAAANLLSRQIDDRWRQLRVLEDLLKWRDLSASVRPEGRPVGSGYVSSSFGARIDPFTGKKAAHKGIDFAGPRGTQIVAVAAGIVTWSGPRAGYGQMIEIEHGNQHVTRYAHNLQNLVEVGDVVTRGQPIAKLGSTGRATGPNLHFEVLQDGRAVNPLPYIE